MMDEILLVDDESGSIESLQRLLQEHAYTVHTATSGEEALSILYNKSIPIVISDIRMPGMDGIELVKKAQKIVPDVQCIFITGYGGRKKAVEATKLGGFSYLQKPLSIDELIVAIWKAQEKLDLLRTIQTMKEKKQNKEQLVIQQIRNAIFDIMNISVRYWELSYGKTKVALAEESAIWTAMLDKDVGCYRTRTMDRYLKISTIPKNPNYNNVLNTGSFVLKKCPHGYPDLEKQLKTKMQQLIDLQRELEIIRS
jgi:YesN/AraC family two-component response regulator